MKGHRRRKKRQFANPAFTVDSNGRELAHVPLGRGDQRATLYADDYRWIINAGWSTCWTLTNTGGKFRYVLVHALNQNGNCRSLTVARLVAGAGKGQGVSYADGDHLNLCGDNLLVRKGTAWAPMAALRPRKEKLSRETGEPRCAFLHQPMRMPGLLDQPKRPVAVDHWT